jgi:maleylacetate reductase
VAQAARETALACDADAVLAVGGGSAIGTAKAVALTSGLPIVAVPTTYAGSETTPVWGLTEGTRKTTGRDPRVLPRVVVYDPTLSADLPLGLSVASGLNAMAHCVETFWAPGRNPISSLVAAEAISALAQGLRALVAGPGADGGTSDGGALGARSRTLYGAYLAGSAFAVAGSGLHHKICHALGGAYRLPHAGLHAVVLPHVLAFTAPAAPDAAARIGGALHTDSAVDGLLALYRDLDAPRSLAQLGMPADALDDAARMIVAVVPADHPRALDLAGARALVQAAWEGREPPREGTP